MRTSCIPVFPGRQVQLRVQLRATAKPITPFGGLVSLIGFFERIGLAGRISELMPFAYAIPNAIPPAQTLLVFIISVVAGARRLAHTDWLRPTRPSTPCLASRDSPAPTRCAISSDVSIISH